MEKKQAHQKSRNLRHPEYNSCIIDSKLKYNFTHTQSENKSSDMHRINSKIDKMSYITNVKYIITRIYSSGKPIHNPENFHSDVNFGTDETKDVGITRTFFLNYLSLYQYQALPNICFGYQFQITSETIDSRLSGFQLKLSLH